MPSVLARMKDLYGKAAETAQSWGNTADKEVALNRKKALSSSNAATNVEQWAVNKAVHYNEWADFSKKDFEPVVAAFHDRVSLRKIFQPHRDRRSAVQKRCKLLGIVTGTLEKAMGTDAEECCPHRSWKLVQKLICGYEADVEFSDFRRHRLNRR